MLLSLNIKKTHKFGAVVPSREINKRFFFSRITQRSTARCLGESCVK